MGCWLPALAAAASFPPRRPAPSRFALSATRSSILSAVQEGLRRRGPPRAAVQYGGSGDRITAGGACEVPRRALNAMARAVRRIPLAWTHEHDQHRRVHRPPSLRPRPAQRRCGDHQLRHRPAPGTAGHARPHRDRRPADRPAHVPHPGAPARDDPAPVRPPVRRRPAHPGLPRLLPRRPRRAPAPARRHLRARPAAPCPCPWTRPASPPPTSRATASSRGSCTIRATTGAPRPASSTSPRAACPSPTTRRPFPATSSPASWPRP